MDEKNLFDARRYEEFCNDFGACLPSSWFMQPCTARKLKNGNEFSSLETLPETGVENDIIQQYMESTIQKNRWKNNKLNAGRVLAIPDGFAIELRNLSEKIANIHLSSPILSNAYYQLEDTLGRVVLDLLNHPQPEQGGFLSTHGATSAITEAVHNSICRYQEKQPYETYKPVVLAPITSNVAFRKAMKLTGIGIDNMVLYDLDENFQPDTKKLEKLATKLEEDGRDILALMAVAGDTEHGIIQDVSRLTTTKKSARYTPAILVDAAFGWYFLAENLNDASATFSNSEVDFMVIDFHKWLGTMSHAMILMKNADDLKYSLLPEEREKYESEAWNFPYSRQHFLRSRAPMTRLTQGAHTIPSNLGVLLKYGKKGLREMSEKMKELAGEFSVYVKQSKRFELIGEPETGVVSFSLRNGDNYKFMEEFNQGDSTILAYSGTIKCRTQQDLYKPVSERNGFWVHFMPYAGTETMNAYIDRLNEIVAK